MAARAARCSGGSARDCDIFRTQARERSLRAEPARARPARSSARYVLHRTRWPAVALPALRDLERVHGRCPTRVAAPPSATAWPASTAEQPIPCARSSAISRACGYGERGSAYPSSPSSHNTIKPRFRTGANTALRVPTTMETSRRRALNQRRYRLAGPRPAESATTESVPLTASHAAATRSRSR